MFEQQEPFPSMDLYQPSAWVPDATWAQDNYEGSVAAHYHYPQQSLSKLFHSHTMSSSGSSRSVSVSPCQSPMLSPRSTSNHVPSHTQISSQPPAHSTGRASSSSISSNPSVRKPTLNASKDRRPRCFEHGCAGRRFSSIENYKRHLREQAGANTVLCEYCNASFSRKSNKDNHVTRWRCPALRSMFEETLHEVSATQPNGHQQQQQQQGISSLVGSASLQQPLFPLGS